MNPMTNIKNIQKLNDRMLEMGVTDDASWHKQYKDSAYVFIGGLPYDLTEGDILCVFSQYGEIVNVNLVRDKKTGKQKGFCFLCYEDQRSTILAVDNFNGIKLGGRTIRVDHCSNYRRPKGDEKDDEGNRKEIIEQGCAPRTPSPSPPPSDDEGPAQKKAKKLKKNKKHKKNKGDKDKRGGSSSEDERSGSRHSTETTQRRNLKRDVTHSVRDKCGMRDKDELRDKEGMREHYNAHHSGKVKREEWDRSRADPRIEDLDRDYDRRDIGRTNIQESTSRRDRDGYDAVRDIRSTRDSRHTGSLEKLANEKSDYGKQSRSEHGRWDRQRFGERTEKHQDREPRKVDREPRRDDRATRKDDRQPRGDDRGQMKDDREPMKDDSKLRKDNKGPRKDDREPRRDDREPRRDDRATRKDDRQPRGDDRGQMKDDREPMKDDSKLRKDESKPRRDDKEPRKDDREPK
ncbi:RNA-binding motif protein, X-linked 2 isoform X2 [Nematostella vectensis]|nr:RNA-binding motif protein, X-linked 2 isoform X2 [Nematostella vectensis]